MAVRGLGRDAVFILNVPVQSDVRVTTSQPVGSIAQAVTYLRMSPCATGTELVCRDSLGSTGALTARALAAGVYALVIDAYDQGSSGRVNVTMSLCGPARCSRS